MSEVGVVRPSNLTSRSVSFTLSVCAYDYPTELARSEVNILRAVHDRLRFDQHYFGLVLHRQGYK